MHGAMCPCACPCVPCSHFSPSHPFPLPCWINVSTHLHSLGQRRGKISSLINSEAKFMQGTTHALYYTMKAAGNNSSVLRNGATGCSKNTYIYKMSPPTCASWGWMGAGAGESWVGMTQELWPCCLPGTLSSTGKGKDRLVAKGPAESQSPLGCRLVVLPSFLWFPCGVGSEADFGVSLAEPSCWGPAPSVPHQEQSPGWGWQQKFQAGWMSWMGSEVP